MNTRSEEKKKKKLFTRIFPRKPENDITKNKFIYLFIFSIHNLLLFEKYRVSYIFWSSTFSFH